MAVLQYYVIKYANEVYCQGTRRFTERDGKPSVPTEYIEPCMQYAAANYSLTNILNVSLGQTWINQEEYDLTCSYRTATSPA
jgi:hypothetical protein